MSDQVYTPVEWWDIPQPFGTPTKIEDGRVTEYRCGTEFQDFLRGKAQFGIFTPYVGTDWEGEPNDRYALLDSNRYRPVVDISFFIENSVAGTESHLWLRREVRVFGVLLGKWWDPHAGEDVFYQLPEQMQVALELYAQHAATYWIRGILEISKRVDEISTAARYIEGATPAGVDIIQPFR